MMRLVRLVRLILTVALLVTAAGGIGPPVASAAPRHRATAAGAPLLAVQPASITGSVGDLVSPVTGGSNPLDPITSGAGALAGVGLAALGAWVLGGAQAALDETASIISQTTRPRLESTWFSATYWRVAGLAALLTLPFLFAAAAQALLRSDLTLLLRAALGYLPMALLAMSLAAPLAMLMLAATDQMCSVVASAGTGGGVNFLKQTATAMAGVSSLGGSPFLGFVIGLFTLAAAIALAVEMLIREAAVYVVLLMIPLAFAALVWPARRVWATRLVELLIALILSKFVIVAVLSLAGAAYGSSGVPTVTRLLTAMSLLMLSTFAPWVMLRLLPFTELAAGAAGALRAEVPRLGRVPRAAAKAADGPAAWVESLSGRLRPQADQADSEWPTGSERTHSRTPSGVTAPGPSGVTAPGAAAGASADAGDDDAVVPGEPIQRLASGDQEAAAGTDPAAAGTDPAAAGTDPAAAGTDPAAAVPEPRPGMSGIWQAGYGEWPPTVLGPGGPAGPVDYAKRLAEEAGQVDPAPEDPPSHGV